MNKGIWYGIGAYGLWGFFPIYWKFLNDVPALEILAHRMAWSLVFVGAILAYRQHWSWVKPAFTNRRILLTYIASACLLALNWFTYIWGVNANFIVETSLGYFINPLVNVVLGVLFLGERPRHGQWLAVAVALIGVGYLTWQYGRLPLIALTLAFSFGFYGLLRKTAALDSLEGLSLETAVLFLPALGYLLFLQSQGNAAFGHSNPVTTSLLAFAGIATAVPLLWFANAARRVTLTTLGILQYLAPTIQFLIGIFIYKEPFTIQFLIGFSLIWAALLIYSAESMINTQRHKPLRYAN